MKHLIILKFRKLWLKNRILPTIMGNICRSLSAQQQRANAMAKIPRSFDEFLVSVISDLKDVPNINQLLTTNVWARKFHDYLQNKNLTDDILTLKFVISVSQLENLHAKLKKTTKLKIKQKLQEDCTKLLQEIQNSYFDIESNVVPMSMEKLQEECMGMDVQVFHESKLELLKKAKKDPTVWHEGLEPVYLQFLNSTNSSMMACLLSIL